MRATLSEEGAEKVAVALVICPFIKGEEGRIPAGTETKAYVDFDTEINVATIPK